MTDEIIDVVDEFDNLIGKEWKSKCHEKGLWHRCAAVVVINTKGELLLQMRSPTKLISPNMYCTSVAGHVVEDESYEDAAVRELKEELGIVSELHPIGKFHYNIPLPLGKINKEHYHLYYCVHDGPFDIEKHAISFVKFFSLEEIKTMIKENPQSLTGGFKHVFENFLKYKKDKRI